MFLFIVQGCKQNIVQAVPCPIHGKRSKCWITSSRWGRRQNYGWCYTEIKRTIRCVGECGQEITVCMWTLENPARQESYCSGKCVWGSDLSLWSISWQWNALSREPCGRWGICLYLLWMFWWQFYEYSVSGLFSHCTDYVFMWVLFSGDFIIILAATTSAKLTTRVCDC